MSQNMMVLPLPRHMQLADHEFMMPPEKLILLNSSRPQALRFTATRFQRALKAITRMNWEIVTSTATPTEQIGLTLRLLPGPAMHPQGYKLEITPEGMIVSSQDEAGIYYGICTLIQVLDSSIKNKGDHYSLPCLRIDDWPDYPIRGVMLDISRDKVPTTKTLFELVDLLSGWKINQLQLYIEHTFAYRNHPEVWENSSPMTGQEILELDAYCRDRYIELVPQQQSAGHMQRWLIHDRYAHLAETHGYFMAPWGEQTQGPFSLCLIDPGSVELMRQLYNELLPHFTSKMFNVCLDETTDLGVGRSKEACEKLGIGGVYLDYLLKIYREVKARGYTMQFWGDVLIQHPELISELPQDIIVLEWGYEANHPFSEHCDSYAVAGLPFYVCPGTSAWGSVAGRTNNALGNLLNAAENGLKYGAIGYLNTDWGDFGHWQVLPISYIGFAVGAAYSWALEVNRDLNVRHAVSWHAFRDRTGAMGDVAYDLGNVYRSLGFEPFCSSVLFWILLWPLEKFRAFINLPLDAYRRAESAIEESMVPIAKAKIERPDSTLILDEYRNTARLLRHACRRGLLLTNSKGFDVARFQRELDTDMGEIIAEYKRIWLARNRPGGLKDSVGRLEARRTEYTISDS